MRRSCATLLVLAALSAQAGQPAHASKPGAAAARHERRTQKRAETLRAQAEAEQLKGHTATALQLLEQAFDLQPEPELLLQMGQCHQQMGNAGRAAFSYRQYLLRSERSDREARSAAVSDREARSAAVTDREARSAAVTDREARSAAVTVNRGDVEDLAARMEALAEAARTDGMIPVATQTRKHP